MSATEPRLGGSTFRYLAVLAAAALTLALLPLAGASAQEEPDDPDDACPEDPPAAPYTDRDEIPEVHIRNVDCVTHRGIAGGFTDGTYRPHAPTYRDQMASFVARTIREAGHELPEADEDHFTDIATNEHRDNINALAEADIVRGGPEGLPASQYGPRLTVRRDQMASFLIRAAEFVFGGDFGSDVQRFVDVDVTNQHFRNVNGAAEHELAQGGPQELPATHYGPERTTTRAHMASFMARLLHFLETFEPEPIIETPEETPGETPDETPEDTPESFTAAPELVDAAHVQTLAGGHVDVRYVFDDDIDAIFDVGSGDEFDEGDAAHELGFHLHTADGENVFGDTAVIDSEQSNEVVVRFIDFTDTYDLGDVVAAAVDADSVGSEDEDENVLTNPEGAVAFEGGGETAAPVLVEVAVEEDNGERTVRFVFDADLDDTDPLAGDFSVYDADGEGTTLSDCDYGDEADEVVCTTEEGFLFIPDPEYVAAGDAVLAGVASGAVTTDAAADPEPRNHADSVPVS